MNKNSVILFLSSNQAIWAAKIIKKEGLKCKMRPIPRNLSSDCGYCVQFTTSDTEKIKNLLKNKQIEFDRIEIL